MRNLLGLASGPPLSSTSVGGGVSAAVAAEGETQYMGRWPRKITHGVMERSTALSVSSKKTYWSEPGPTCISVLLMMIVALPCSMDHHPCEMDAG